MRAVLGSVCMRAPLCKLFLCVYACMASSVQRTVGSLRLRPVLEQQMSSAMH